MRQSGYDAQAMPIVSTLITPAVLERPRPPKEAAGARAVPSPRGATLLAKKASGLRRRLDNMDGTETFFRMPESGQAPACANSLAIRCISSGATSRTWVAMDQ
jgi:hypothetical protein